MKTLFILVPIVLFSIVACQHSTTNQSKVRYTFRRDFPDYPDIIKQQHLEVAFDSARWLFYKSFGCKICHSWFKGKLLFETINNFSSKHSYSNYNSYGPNYHLEYIVEDTASLDTKAIIAQYSIGVDTVIVQNDTAHFVLRAMYNDSIYCAFYRQELPNGLERSGGLYYTIGVLLSADTIVYAYDGEFVHKIDYWNYPAEDQKKILQMANCLEEQLSDTSVRLNPWLRQEAQRCGIIK